MLRFSWERYSRIFLLVSLIFCGALQASTFRNCLLAINKKTTSFGDLVRFRKDLATAKKIAHSLQDDLASNDLREKGQVDWKYFSNAQALKKLLQQYEKAQPELHAALINSKEIKKLREALDAISRDGIAMPHEQMMYEYNNTLFDQKRLADLYVKELNQLQRQFKSEEEIALQKNAFKKFTPEDIAKQRIAISDALPSFVGIVASLNWESKTPTWNQVNELHQMRDRLYQLGVADPKAAEWIQEQFKSLPHDQHAKLQTPKEYPANYDYEPSEFLLKQEMHSTLEDILAIAHPPSPPKPKAMGFMLGVSRLGEEPLGAVLDGGATLDGGFVLDGPLPDYKIFRTPALPAAGKADFANLREDSRAIVAKSKRDFEEKNLYATSGFQNKDELLDAARSIESKHTAEIIRIFEGESLQLVRHNPQAGRWWLPLTGFANQFTTKSSEGSYNPSGRNNLESMMLNMPIDEYSALNPFVKTKYLTLEPPLGSELKPNTSVKSQYSAGSGDSYYIDIAKVKDRLTLTLGDSLNRRRYVEGHSSWDARFISWEDRELLIPHSIKGAENGTLSLEYHGDNPLIKAVVGPRSEYHEAQVTGPLTLDEVTRFDFSNDPPTGRFLLELLSHGIEVTNNGVPYP